MNTFTTLYILPSTLSTFPCHSLEGWMS